MIASIKRQLLAWYLDFLLFTTIYNLAMYFAGLTPAYGLVIELGIFVALRALLGRVVLTPGEAMLSIDADGNVNSGIQAGENWLTMLLGVFFVVEGTKRMVRWTQIPYPEPYLGFIPDWIASVILKLAFGLVFVVTGWLILKLHRAGFWLGVGTAIFYMVSTVLSWQLWVALVPFLQSARRNLQGLPIRDGEIEFMQTALPAAITGCSALILVALLFSAPRLTRPT